MKECVERLEGSKHALCLAIDDVDGGRTETSRENDLRDAVSVEVGGFHEKRPCVYVASNGMKSRIVPAPPPSNARTTLGPPGARCRDEVIETVAVDVTRADPHAVVPWYRKKAKKLATVPAPFPPKTFTCGPPPAPAPVITSAKPSPLISPEAT